MSLAVADSPPGFHVARPLDQQRSLFGSAAALPWIVAGCAACTAAYIAVDDPSDGQGGLTPCPIRALTGRWCPGCGVTRGTHHLLRGDITQALSYNAAIFAIVCGLIVLWATWLLVATGRGVPRFVQRIGPSAYAGAGLLLGAFTVVRNVAGAEVLRGG